MQMALLAIFGSTVFALQDVMPKTKRAIGIFNVVKFPNDACDSTSASMNGTCYTAEECASKDGTASGECADGYGVCCVITVACAGSTSENGTYLTQMASTTPATDTTTSQSCTYSICPRTSTVSRIRLDLTEFSIAGPTAADTDGSANNAQGAGSAIGHCTADSFSVTGAPVICGTNMGQHMIVDSDGSTCISAAFSFGLSTTTSRAYTIKVTQFESTNEMGGPAGCLQFFTGDTGTVNTFNWNDVATSTHLANQNYDVCVRAGIDKCIICWSPTTLGAIATPVRGSFGISNGLTAIAAMPVNGAGAGECGSTVTAGVVTDSDDFILIPGGQTKAQAEDFTTLTVGFDKFCGRFLAPTPLTAATAADSAICSTVLPFKLGVSFDGVEAVAAAAGAVQMTITEEASGAEDPAASTSPLGTMGFSLGYEQLDC